MSSEKDNQAQYSDLQEKILKGQASSVEQQQYLSRGTKVEKDGDWIEKLYKAPEGSSKIKKGIHFYTKRVPASLLNIASISDSQKFINNQFMALNSNICPECGNGIMMFDKRYEYQNGEVDWFCGNNKCGYKIIGPKGKMGGGFNPELKQILYADSFSRNRERWAKLSEEEKEELKASHLGKHRIFFKFYLMTLILFIVTALLNPFFSVAVALFSLSMFLLCLKWSYRIYQIEHGFFKHYGFLLWMKKRENLFHITIKDVFQEINEKIKGVLNKTSDSQLNNNKEGRKSD